MKYKGTCVVTTNKAFGPNTSGILDHRLGLGGLGGNICTVLVSSKHDPKLESATTTTTGIYLELSEPQYDGLGYIT